MLKKWVINTPDENAVKELAVRGGLTMPAARALVCGGIDDLRKAAEFFGQEEEYNEAETDGRGLPVPAFGKGYTDPFLICDMSKACDLLNKAVDSGEPICVYGDYDCDGITAAAVLSGYLRDIGANVTVYINERAEGYGMNCDAVRKLHEQGVRTIVTVDNGISAIEEAKLCRELGITLIVTDHHLPGEELPDADAVIDPHREDCPSEYKDFCGCGVALKLIAAMEGGDMERVIEQYSDIAAIATVADVVPLTGENRKIVRHGLHYMENTENIGLRALIEKSGLRPPYKSVNIAFGLAPRINAAGRVGSPMDALALLQAEDPAAAAEAAEKICRMNAERQALENKVVADIVKQMREDASVLDGRVQVFRGEDWDHGIIGIAASRCVDKYGKPVFLMSKDGENMLRGSARSVEGFDVFGALTHCAELLTKFGGHTGAGGFSLPEENFDKFRTALEEYALICEKENGVCRACVQTCGVIPPAELTVNSVRGLDALEPFGEGNPRPVFLMNGCVINGITPVSGGAHIRLDLLYGGRRFTGMLFRTRPEQFPFKRGDNANVLVSPEINEYNGNVSVSLLVQDIRRAGLNQQQLLAAEDTYCRFRRGEDIDSRLVERITPDRDDLAAVYRAAGTAELSPVNIFARLQREMNYCKFLICLDIFEESGLIKYDRCAETVSVIKGAAKADTEQAPSMQRLKALSPAEGGDK